MDSPCTNYCRHDNRDECHYDGSRLPSNRTFLSARGVDLRISSDSRSLYFVLTELMLVLLPASGGRACSTHAYSPSCHADPCPGGSLNRAGSAKILLLPPPAYRRLVSRRRRRADSCRRDRRRCTVPVGERLE